MSIKNFNKYTLVFLFIAFASSSFAQNKKTIFVKHSSIVILQDTTYTIKNDTLINIPSDSKYEIREIPDAESVNFFFFF